MDCEVIGKHIGKYEKETGKTINYLSVLKEKYLTNIDNLCDPWGNKYKLNKELQIVYSTGPDGIDDIYVSYSKTD